MEKKLYYNQEGNQIQLYVDGKCIRYTDISYLPDWWQGLHDQELAQRGVDNLSGTIAWITFRLWFEDLNEVTVYFTHNYEYKVSHRGTIHGFTDKRSAENCLSSILWHEEKIDFDWIDDDPSLLRGDIRAIKTYHL